MSAPSSRPAGAGRAATSARRLGAPAATCLLATILAANQAAARPDASLPYLAHAGPEPLRFALPRVIALARPRFVPPRADAKPDSETTAADPAKSGGVATTTSKPDPAKPVAAVGVKPATDAAAQAPATTPGQSAPAADPGVELVPDTYAPPPVVRVEDLLPFFVPPVAPASRATYELK